MKVSFLLLVVTLFCVSEVYGQLTFSITAAFLNVKPSGKSYYDFCGFPCSGSGVEDRTDYCDFDCRDDYKCTVRVPLIGLCLSHESVWGPFCYTNGCPSIFNQAKSAQFQVRWGQPAESTGQSGMGFNPMSGALPIQKEFKLGELIHYNWPIYAGTFVEKYTFQVKLTINRGNEVVLRGATFSFDMTVDETTNSLGQKGCGGSCPYSSREPLQCSRGLPYCPDRIMVTTGVSDVKFALNNGQYTLALSGFRLYDQQQTLNYFISDEGRFTPAEMYGVVTQACPTCPNKETQVFFDLKTLMCSCPCTNTACPANQVRQPDCSCKCPTNLCNVGAVAKPDATNFCKCDCSTGTCPSPRVPTDAIQNCGCTCPNNCARGGTPNQNSPNCACDCPACPPNFVNSPTCNCVCGLTASSCGPAQVFDSASCSCKCKFSCPAGFGAQGAGCVCPCDTTALAPNASH
eukprot:TRINITY_DN3022_c0_g1_i4.p1 TRINITY_DN3022_c0_g1~~TRINITY_DN3022_c0_g1_i4.p1  ORF type:complete len:459 (-),score=55.41 TRINITY_DN3022_c0_g1_i4:51-1427(-)